MGTSREQMTGLFNESAARAGWPPPRASLLASDRIPGRLWMGGAHARHGADVDVDHLREALVVDCAGDLPGSHREWAGTWWSCVFADLEAFPSQLRRIGETARAAADRLHEPETGTVFVFCQYGMNRSGLVTGAVLRELGFAADEAVAMIRAARPGALSNLTFTHLIATYRPGPGWEGL